DEGASPRGRCGAAGLHRLQGPGTVEPDGPELGADRKDDLRARRVLRVTSRHRQALAGRDRQLARPVRRDGVGRQGNGRDTAQRNGSPRTLVRRYEGGGGFAPPPSRCPSGDIPELTVILG